jgi:hypothetical protein
VSRVAFPPGNQLPTEIIKIDHTISNKWSVYYRFENDKIPTVDANALFSSGSQLPGVSTTETNSPGRTHTFQSTHVLSPSLVVVGRYTYGYGAILSSNVGTLALVNSPITPPLPFTNQRDRVPTISGNGFSNLQSFGPYDNFSYKHNFSGDATWTRSAHIIKFGGVFGYYRKNENALAETMRVSIVVSTTRLPQVRLRPAFWRHKSWAGHQRNTACNFQFLQTSFRKQCHILAGAFDYTADLRQKVIEGYGRMNGVSAQI